MTSGDSLSCPAIRGCDSIDFLVLNVSRFTDFNINLGINGCDLNIRANKVLGVVVWCHWNVLNISVFGILIRSRNVRFGDERELVLMTNHNMGVQDYVVWLN